jgi:hypothetical protein
VQVFVSKEGQSSEVQMSPDELVHFGGEIPIGDMEEIMDVIERFGDLFYGYMRVEYGVRERTPALHEGPSPKPNTSEWLAVLALFEFPKLGYSVSVVAEPAEGDA